MDNKTIHCSGDVVAHALKEIKINKTVEGSTEEDLFEKMIDRAKWIKQDKNEK